MAEDPLYRLLHPVLPPIARAVWRPRVEGLHHVPATGGVLLASNHLSWQWVAGCGADAAPYFRVFNPLLQSEKFDAGGSYIRRWVPELERVPAATIHRPWEMSAAEQRSAGIAIGGLSFGSSV